MVCWGVGTSSWRHEIWSSFLLAACRTTKLWRFWTITCSVTSSRLVGMCLPRSVSSSVVNVYWVLRAPRWRQSSCWRIATCWFRETRLLWWGVTRVWKRCVGSSSTVWKTSIPSTQSRRWWSSVSWPKWGFGESSNVGSFSQEWKLGSISPQV